MIDASSRGAWRTLVDELRPFVARRVLAADVEDVLQDVFLRMQRALPELRDEERFGAWVYKVARSAIADHRRAAARRPQSAEPVPDPAADDDDDDDRAAERALASHVAAFVARLPSPYREALTLTELEGLTQKEAADMLGISLSGMKSRVQRGRRLLREALEQCCHIALDAQRRVIEVTPRPNRDRPDGCCSDP